MDTSFPGTEFLGTTYKFRKKGESSLYLNSLILQSGGSGFSYETAINLDHLKNSPSYNYNNLLLRNYT